ncbi:putative 2OG-Fe(II) oxygenase [Streptomyces sp. NPDC046805]|uniref:2OG-Fe(II)-dependent halogenase WelO5 family protein n=1 Tax=Streptomyces sp. NPDC046805 TaxID=3155134 RepID=UPI0033DD80D7
MTTHAPRENAAAPSGNVSANNSPIYTLFDVDVTTTLQREHILRLAAGVSGAIHVRGFGLPEDCRDIMEALAVQPLGAYDEAFIYPRIAKLGPAAYDFYVAHGLDEEYWKHAEDAVAVRSALLRGTDPMDYAVERVREGWGGDVEYARSGGRPMFAGMIREIANGAKLHFDEITRESPGLLDETPASFLTLNWYLDMPEHGGSTSVHRHRWRPTDEQYRDRYGYTTEAVADEPFVTVRPEPGDAVLFDSRNLHSIEQISGAGRRVTLSFFLGITGRGPLHLWS